MGEGPKMGAVGEGQLVRRDRGRVPQERGGGVWVLQPSLPVWGNRDAPRIRLRGNLLGNATCKASRGSWTALRSKQLGYRNSAHSLL